MKKIWDQFRGWKYFRVVVIIFGILVTIWLIYILFIRGFLQFRQNEKLFVEGVKSYYEYNPLKLPKEGGYTEHKLSEMFQGSWVESIYVPGKSRLCDGDSFVRVANENGKYRYITYLKCGRYESNVDHKAPDIALNEEDTVIVPLGEEYKDAGVKEVKDNVDKIDLSKVTVDSSKVDTNKMGTYEVTYRVRDNNYNIARKIRTVIVTETLSSHIQKSSGANFTYTGVPYDNYVLFSGMLWRIVKLDAEGNLALITDNTIANVAYGSYDKAYPDSNIYKWLNQYFFSNIHENSQKYIVESKWCYDDMASLDQAETCNSSVNAKVGLLSLGDYQRTVASDGRSYLRGQSLFYMINRQSSQKIWISNIYNNAPLEVMNINDMVGVRPVIYLSKDIYVTAGSGLYDDPYKLQDYTYAKENDLLNTRLTGEYVAYSGYTFRVAGTDLDGNTRLVAIDLLKNSSNNQFVSTGYNDGIKVEPKVNEDGNLYHFLNQEAMNHISEKSIVAHEFEIPLYKSGSDFDNFESKKITSKIGLPASFEMFSGFNYRTNGNQIYWLSDYQENDTVSIINGNNGIAFYLNRDTFPENAIKPVIYVKKNLKIASGKGTVPKPYYVR